MTDHDAVLALARELRSTDATRHAALGGKNVSYVKGVRLVEYLEKRGRGADATAIGNALLRDKLVVKEEIADRKHRALRYTHERPSQFERDFFYVWQIEGSSLKRNVMLGVVIVSVLGLVLFPVWPQWAKVGVWYVSMTLLIVLTGFIFGRVAAFLLLYGVGIDFWILPNFFADDLDFYSSFRPAVSFALATREELRASWPYRLVVLLCLVSFAYWVVTAPTEFDVFVAQQRQFVDELYEGTLLSDKSQKEKERVDRVVPDSATLQRELEDLERLEREEAAKNAKLDAIVDAAMKAVEGDDDEDDEPEVSAGVAGAVGGGASSGATSATSAADDEEEKDEDEEVADL